MKRLILLIISLVLLTPVIIYAEDENYEYNSINLSAIFVTSADVSGINKIKVNYRTFYNGRDKEETIYLLRENNFSTTISTGTINDATYSYGYCITRDEHPDKYGFLPITAERKFNDNNKSIDIVLSVDFNSMKYDGKKYRENSDVSVQEMIDRKNGVKNDAASVSSSNNKETTTTTKSEVVVSDDPIVIGESTTTVIKDTNKDITKKKEEKETDYNKLIPIIIVIGIVLFIFIIFTTIKIARSNKRV